MREQSGQKPIPIGKIVGLYGVRGWVKIHSDTRPPERIFGYREWLVGPPGKQRRMVCAEGRRQGKSLVARLEGFDDRDQSRLLLGDEVAITRTEFAAPGQSEHYWVDLIGLEVVNLQGTRLGKVARLMETGANDVLVLNGDRERLLPYIPEVVRKVDLENGVVQVDWDSDF